MNPEIQKLIDSLKDAPKIEPKQVEPIAVHASAITDDKEFVTFLQAVPTRLLSLIGEVSPTIVARVSNIVKVQEEPIVKDVNVVEKVYAEQD